MAPRLRVLVSGGGGGYPPLTPCPVNSPEPTALSTDGFEGSVWVYVKGYNGELKRGDGAEYFSEGQGQGEGRQGMSYGIIVRGRFKKDLNADQVVFGNVFEKPIRDNLPWGTSIATKFMYFVDPTVEADIYADKPWALSPALATMAHLALREGNAGSSGRGSGGGGEEKTTKTWVEEDSVEWLNAHGADIPSPSAGANGNGNEKTQISSRRKWLGNKQNREKITITKETEVEMEFCNGLLDFNTLSATLPQPFSLSIPLLKYWDGQPVTYVCQAKPPSGNLVGGEVYWSVAFEIVDEEARAQLEAKGGAVTGGGDKVGDDDDEEVEEEGDFEDAQEGNDDVD